MFYITNLNWTFFLFCPQTHTKKYQPMSLSIILYQICLQCRGRIPIIGLTSIFCYSPHLTHHSTQGMPTSPGTDFFIIHRSTYVTYTACHRYFCPSCDALCILQPSTHQAGLPSHAIQVKSAIIWYAPLTGLPRKAFLNDMSHYTLKYSMLLLLTTLALIGTKSM